MLFTRAMIFAICVFASLFAGQLKAEFIIEVNYSGDVQYASAFTTAAATWESLISGYQNGVVASTPYTGTSYIVGQTVNTLYINATIEPIDGPSGILGSAGPDSGIVDQLGFTLATDGSMTFDSADVPGLVTNGTFNDVILHEMAHVMGLGTLWSLNNVYSTDSGEFTGANATAAWQSEFGQTGTPDVELGGGGGTANGHWNEVDGGAGLTGITDSQGRDMRNELMTGWLNGNSFISEMTIASFVDIGFSAAPQAIVATPEPGALTLFAVGLCGISVRRRRS